MYWVDAKTLNIFVEVVCFQMCEFPHAPANQLRIRILYGYQSDLKVVESFSHIVEAFDEDVILQPCKTVP